jgi:hypothetical protein
MAGIDEPPDGAVVTDEALADALRVLALRFRHELWAYRDVLAQLTADQIYLYSTALGAIDNLVASLPEAHCGQA